MMQMFRCFCKKPARILTLVQTTSCLIIFPTILCSSLSAQNISGTITGTIKDSSGAVVPNASITITNTGQNAVVFTAKTNSAGQYTAPFLPVGNYFVAAEASGFKKAEHTGIKLSVSQNLTIDIVLEPGSTQQTVSVSASALQVDLRLNQRPRKTLDFATPASKLQASVASTG